MGWYLGQSWIMIGASFLLGLSLGWALWRLPWRKRYFGESDTISALNREHTIELAERDEEIELLRNQLSRRAVTDHLPNVRYEDPRYLAAQGQTTAASAAAAAERHRAAAHAAASTVDGGELDAYPHDGWVDSEDELAEAEADEVQAHAEGGLANDADYGPPGPRPPSLFPTGANELAGTAHPPAPIAVDLRGDAPAAAPSNSRSEQAQPRDDRATSQERASAVTDLRSGELTRITGITSEVARALGQAGLRTYQDVASARPHEVRAALEAAGISTPGNRSTWPRQAQLLADGDENGFAQLARELVGNNDTTRRS